jgi:putative component of toxin-antitoxin plasmid stabilization module
MRLPPLFVLILIVSLSFSAPVGANEPLEVVDLSGQHLFATVTVPSANLRTQPSLNGSVRFGAVQGARFSVLGATGSGDNRWFLIQRTTSDTAWVSASVVQVGRASIAADFAPEISTMYISLDTSPGFFDRLDELFTIYNNGFGGISARGDIDQLIGALFLNPEISAEEVRPWLGNEVAIINLQCLSTTMSDFLMTESLQETPRPSVVIMAQSVDLARTRAFINQVINSGTLRNAPRSQVTYNGITYTLLNDPAMPDYNPEAQALALGIVDEFAVFTQGADSFNAIIDAARGVVPTLEDSTRFREVYYQLDGTPFLKVYVSPGLFCPVHEPILYEALLSDAYREGQIDLPGVEARDPAALQDQLIALLDTAFYGYGVSFGKANTQLEVNVVSGYDIDALIALSGLSAEQIDQRVGQAGLELFGFLRPSAMQGLTFGRMTEDYDELRAMAGATPEVVFETATGLSRDLLDWFEGTITMGFIDYPLFAGGGIAERPAYFLLILETETDQQAQQAMDNFFAAAMQQPAAADTAAVVEGVEALRVVNGEGETVEVAALENFVILTTGSNLDRVIRNGRETADGRFYPDWQLLAGLPRATELAQTAPEAAPFVAFLDMGRMLFAGETSLQPEAVMFSKPNPQGNDTTGISTRIETAAIVTPPDALLVELGIENVDPALFDEDQLATLITIICRICNTTNC